MIKLLLSFDHELSLGGTSCYKTNLFDPTDNIINLANDLNVPITLFTDILCAKRFKEWDKSKFFKPYVEQIAKALDSRHDVQLHVHPHWIDSEYRDGRFIPSRNYKLADFYDHPCPNNIQGIVKQGIDFLKEITAHHHGHLCIAYRAGGYNLSPQTQLIISALYNNGIRIDSSVTKGFYFKSEISEIDYRRMPDNANWFISKDGTLDQVAASGILEVPIACRPRGTMNNLPFLIKRVLFKHRAYNSCGKGIHGGHTSVLEKLKRLFPRSVWMLSFDNYTETVRDLMKTINIYINSHQEDNTIICSSISHPKSMGKYGLTLMRDFVNKIRQDYGDSIEFCTYQQIYHELNLSES
ncbi:hypothetical protein C4544_04235 [candidate division WS5 bacterium]|uniref:NodB homology domain-containing protein n=1 Tax=candidate division WS5 bacterium TaxID=2093353 RepID=A0A419DCG3_9BACT|nr:MAG: hypothetical protein C4544_04235 [candidate division WS5 bacterium]